MEWSDPSTSQFPFEGEEEGEEAAALGEDEDEEEEGEGEEEEEEQQETVEKDDEEEDYQLRFEGQLDPLLLAEQAEKDGAQPYQQFQRLEYEALAARKRKSLALQEQSGAKKARPQEVYGGDLDEIWEATGFSFGVRKTRKRKRKGRRKQPPGTRGPRLPPEVTKKLGDANLLYAKRQFEEAVELLKEVVRLAPNVPDPYHTLGLIYNDMGERKKAINFYMIAAHLTPKDISLWKRLASWSMEEGSTGQVIYCLQRAIRADPGDVHAKWDLASLYANLKDYSKAAETFEQILALCKSDVEVCKMIAKMHQKSGHFERATQCLEQLVSDYPTEADLTAIHLLASLYIESKDFSSAISCIERARRLYCTGQGLPLNLAVKAGICHAQLGNHVMAEKFFEGLVREQVEESSELLLEIGDTFLEIGQHQLALKYYGMLEEKSPLNNDVLWKNMAECYAGINDQSAAIRLYRKVLIQTPHNVNIRLALASLLANSNQEEEAVNVLFPPESAEQEFHDEKPWWLDGKIKLKLAQIYHIQEKLDLFVDTILPCIQEVFSAEAVNRKIKGKSRLSKKVLAARAKWLDDSRVDSIFHGFRPTLSQRDKIKAERAKRALAKLEEKKTAALAAGLTWQSDEEPEEETVGEEKMVVSIPDLFNVEEHFQLVLQACKALVSLKRHWEALEVINNTLKLSFPYVVNKRDDLRNLGAQIAYKASDAKHGFDCVRYMVQQQPYSISAWNCYYQAVSRSEQKVPKHKKFMLAMRAKYQDCVPPMVICGHQFSMINQPQGALHEYLHAHKAQPDDPFINLCVGVSFINLSLGMRLKNRNQCVLQGFAFLYNYQRLSNGCQESNYNLARAYHHVGLVHLAVIYYQKVLAHRENDHRVVKSPQDSLLQLEGTGSEKISSEKMSKHCDLQREAAFNLHLIYKKSGAMDLARQVLQDFCIIW